MILSFSVVIPTKNRLDGLLNVLSSILGQSLIPDNIIIIDQSDRTNSASIKKLFRSFSYTTFKYIYNKKITGLVDAKNQSLKYISTDLIFFLEDDEILLENYFQNMHKAFVSNKNIYGLSGIITNHPKNSLFYLLFFNLFHVGIFNDKRPSLFFKYSNGSTNDLISSDKISGGVSAWKASVFNFVKFDTTNNLHYTEDIDFSSRVAKEFPNSLFISLDSKLMHFPNTASRDYALIMQKKIQEYKIFIYKRISITNLISFFWLLIGFFMESIFLSIKNLNINYFVSFVKGLICSSP
jgi:GT2 family glycosyltransferase